MHQPLARSPRAPSFGEFVALIGLMMGLTALSIDNLLPAFGPIQAGFGIADDNELQLVVTSYMMGFGLMQLVYGPLSDSIGRRPVLMLGLAVFAAGTALAMIAWTFPMLLTARAVQGMGAAAARVLAVAIVRDRYEGREMARVMSLTMIVFITVPIVAPVMGSLILLAGSWRLIFACMLTLALVVAAWFGLRMPETLHPEYRRALSPRAIAAAIRMSVNDRASLGYSTAVALMMGCLMAYISSAQQIFETSVFRLGPWFPAAFAVIAAVMGVASFVNARLVRRLGMRRLSHAGLCGFAAVSAVLCVAAFAFDGAPPLLLFGFLLAAAQFLFGLIMPNFNSMAMEPLGAVAGTASSFIGFYTILLGTSLGMVVGQAFDGTVVPLSLGYLALSAVAVLVVLWAESGRLFVPHHEAPGT
ncbi:multidrug effflux MFS transporter [Chelatococcus sp. SYSU_G07232]|uniref:Multidrug effflux MFS transporter n=1 Tax=Chelatococcus albus TaxID=3047466 RepID=A0ABT7AIZ3_9HYPH|nr:multidrug effflux MFS transporter [Chelatococcus sp. SYSU_G07232]MDJ1159334.1 multidrug effflux MFS transporter [Chelatococcus sp. SYSU_G07232]